MLEPSQGSSLGAGTSSVTRAAEQATHSSTNPGVNTELHGEPGSGLTSGVFLDHPNILYSCKQQENSVSSYRKCCCKPKALCISRAHSRAPHIRLSASTKLFRKELYSIKIHSMLCTGHATLQNGPTKQFVRFES